MAKIPQQHATELPPVVKSHGIAGRMVGGALAEAGRDVYGMGVELQQAHDALMKAHQTAVYNQKISQATVDLLAMQERAVDDTDYATMPERYASEIDDYRSGMLSDVDDPLLNEKVGLKFDEIATQKLINIRGYARKGIISEGEASVDAALESLSDVIVKTTDPRERATYIGMAEGIIKGGTAAGYYYADKEQELLSKFADDLPVKQVQHDLFALGPSAVFLKLSRMEYPDLNDNDRVTLLNTAHAMLTRQETDNEDYKKKRWDDTEMEMWSLFADSKLTRNWLEEKRRQRIINPEDYEAGIKALITGIWPEDHAFSTPDYQNAHSFLKKQLQVSGPGAEVLYPGESQYISDAEREFQDKVGKGQDPWGAVDETLERYPPIIKRGVNMLPRPLYGPREIKTLADVDQAKANLGEAIREGKITKEQAEAEFVVICDLEDAIKRMNEILEGMEDLDKKVKKRKR
jgi:hypothetical protein